MQSYVLLDRDGVINVDRPGSVLHRREFELLPRVGEAIAQMNRKGYRVLVLTNQACIGRGELSWEELSQIHSLMQRLIVDAGGSVDAIYVCPHVDGDNCDCRKPRPGLVRQAQLQHDFRPVDTWMVGDAQSDIEAAITAGCRPALVRTGKGAAVRHVRDVAIFDDLAHFARNLPDSRDSA